jgi:hypothetical protein
MDAVTGEGRRVAAARIRTAAADAGIRPEDPLGPLMAALADTVEALAKLPAATAREMAPVETRMRELTVTAQQVAQRPLIDAGQIRYEILPYLLAVAKWSQVLIGVLLLLGAFAAGVGYMHWRTPAVACSPQPNGGVFCGYWAVPPSK